MIWKCYVVPEKMLPPQRIKQEAGEKRQKIEERGEEKRRDSDFEERDVVETNKPESNVKATRSSQKKSKNQSRVVKPASASGALCHPSIHLVRRSKSHPCVESNSMPFPCAIGKCVAPQSMPSESPNPRKNPVSV